MLRGQREAYADSPDKNTLFHSLRILSAKYGNDNFNTPRIETWQDFCRLAYNGYLADLKHQKRCGGSRADFDEADFT